MKRMAFKKPTGKIAYSFRAFDVFVFYNEVWSSFPVVLQSANNAPPLLTFGVVRTGWEARCCGFSRMVGRKTETKGFASFYFPPRDEIYGDRRLTKVSLPTGVLNLNCGYEEQRKKRSNDILTAFNVVNVCHNFNFLLTTTIPMVQLPIQKESRCGSENAIKTSILCIVL